MTNVTTASVSTILRSFNGVVRSTEQEQVRKVVEYASKVYGDRMHWSGVTLLDHALGVLHFLVPFQPDTDTIVACILQHALETRSVSTSELQEEFGSTVRSIVSAVHLLSHVSMRSRGTSIEDLKVMLLSVSDDVRVLLIVLCDRCFVAERLKQLSPVDQRRTCRGILDLFAPVAARLGIHSIKQRLESLAFPVAFPADSERVTAQVKDIHAHYGEFLTGAARALKAALHEHGISAVVQGREKQLYSIFRKLSAKGSTRIENLHDLFALRVVVDREEDCYRVLGILHRIGHPVGNRFKDYIAFPKPNGYQSLHSTLTKLPGVPEKVFVEVQIRTKAMHREAEYGVAAHWMYKEGTGASRHRAGLLQALAAQHSVEGESTSQLVDHIFVLTPKGDVVELPEGATPIDFAFQIHTDLGISFRGARVNGNIVSLDHELENGDVVEILTHPTPRPSPEWLQLLKMASSRTRLKRYLNTLHRDDYVARGREQVNEELRRRHLPVLDTDLSLLRQYEGETLTIRQREDLLMKLGQGSDKLSAVLQKVDKLRSSRPVPNALQTGRPRMQRKDSLIDLGDVQMPARFAKCCNPKYEDKPKIFGIISRGEVVVHAGKCRNALRCNPERRVEVKWRAN